MQPITRSQKEASTRQLVNPQASAPAPPPLGGSAGCIVGIDVRTADGMLYALAEDGNGGNTGWLIAGKAAFKLDIATGKTTRAGTISGLKANARDIAVLAN